MTIEWQPTAGPDSLGIARFQGAVRIELRRPDVLNAFDTTAAVDLLETLRDCDADESVRSVLLTGSGRAFSAGADIGIQFRDDHARSLIEKELREVSGPLIQMLRELRKPVIAAVNGPAAGFGCSIALASDLVIAAESAYFLLAFANIGLTPDGGASLLVPARAGLGRAALMAMLAERVPAPKALEWGLADRVVPDAELAQTSAQLAVRLAAGPTRSFAATKHAFNQAVLPLLSKALDTEATLQGQLAGTNDFLEGTAAFTAKRAPVFRGQ